MLSEPSRHSNEIVSHTPLLCPWQCGRGKLWSFVFWGWGAGKIQSDMWMVSRPCIEGCGRGKKLTVLCYPGAQVRHISTGRMQGLPSGSSQPGVQESAAWAKAAALQRDSQTPLSCTPFKWILTSRRRPRQVCKKGGRTEAVWKWCLFQPPHNYGWKKPSIFQAPRLTAAWFSEDQTHWIVNRGGSPGEGWHREPWNSPERWRVQGKVSARGF